MRLRRRLPRPTDDEERRVIDNVRTHGWQTRYVSDAVHPHHGPMEWDDPALARASEHGFTYTVGLWAHSRHPELIVTGTDPLAMERAHAIVGAAVARIRDDGMRFAPGDEDGKVLGGEHQVRFGAVADRYCTGLLTWSHWAARRRHFEALQLFLPDWDGRWPGDERYDGAPQPVLAEAAAP